VSYAVIILDPALDFIDTLENRMQAKIFRSVDLLRETGPMLRMPHSKKVAGYDNLFELRTQLGNNIVRLFYFHRSGVTYVLTSGYIKKDQKLDVAEIAKAIKLKKYFENKDTK